MTRPQAIAFDLDGTLIDSAGGIAHALNTALAQHGLPAFELAAVRRWIGDGPDALIAHALAATAMSPATPADQSELAARLRSSFDQATLREPMRGSRVFDGIAELLNTLAARLPLAVVTNKPTGLACAVLHEAGLLAHFSAVHGADLASQRKPSPLLLWQAASDLGVASRALLMVGDAAPDLAAAQAAGCPAAWVGWGYGHIATAPPLWHLRTPGDLLTHLEAPATELQN